MSIVLGSRSPRRRELLQPLVGAGQLMVCPPASSEEAGFDGLQSADAIEQRLQSIVRTKLDDVRQQSNVIALTDSCVLTADTVVVAIDDQGQVAVLGQPDSDHWQEDVRHWFTTYYAGRTHEVWTGFCVARGDQLITQTVKTSVSFCDITSDMIDWYIGTKESVGKAGGYAIQGAAAAFVTAIDGSLTAIIGLPVHEVAGALTQLGLPSYAAGTLRS